MKQDHKIMAIRNSDEVLSGCIWYWADISRDDVNSMMKDTIDGSFMVRDASNHQETGEYTLVIRKAGTSKLIKIKHENGYYGFADPVNFPSVQELISFYTHNTLVDYNPVLDIKLSYPICKSYTFHYHESDGDNDGGDQEGIVLNETTGNDMLKRHLEKASRDYDDLNHYHELYSDTLNVLNVQIKERKTALMSHNEMINILEDHIKLNSDLRAECLEHEIKKMDQNKEYMKKKILLLQDSRIFVEKDLKQLKLYLKQMEREINTIIPKLNQYKNQIEKIQSLLTSSSSFSSSTHHVASASTL